MPQCKQCNNQFTIYPEDKEFYQRIGVSEPTLCPDCRKQRRMVFRNESNLYNRKCSLSGKNIISMYSEKVPFPVYEYDVWHSDKWDALDYGQVFNFQKPFFEQFQELYNKVPRINFMNQVSENSEYTNYAYRNKNCYLIFGSHYNEDCLYGNYLWKNLNCLDCLEVIKSELAYEAIYSENLYHCFFVEYCFDCHNCFFSYDLRGCKNCILCSNLRNKEYYIFNKPCSKEEFEKFNLLDYSFLQKYYQQYLEVRKKAIKRDMFQKNCENCLGTDIQNSKNIYLGFNAKYIENCRYVDTQITHVNDSMDLTCIGYDPSELLYECIGNTGNSSAMFANSCWHNSNITYCEQCFDSKNLFGCIGIKHKRNCLLNKQYAEKDYILLKNKIIDYMKKTGEYGEFFPAEMSVFKYQETMADLYFPSNKIVEKNKCTHDFKLTKQELKFYKEMKIATPRLCPKCRQQKRLSLKTPRKLWASHCSNCHQAISTCYSSDSKENVYCERCYNQAIY